MAQRDDPPEMGRANARSAEDILRTLTGDLKNLQQDIIIQLARDVSRLQGEKSRLAREIEQLQTKRKQLSDTSGDAIAPSPLWTQQMAQLLAAQLKEQLWRQTRRPIVNPFGSFDGSPGEFSQLESGGGHLDFPRTSDELAASLNNSLNTSYRDVERELRSPHSSLSQQLRQIQDLQQQGEAILEALVYRLSQQVHLDATQRSSSPATIGENGGTPALQPPDLEKSVPSPASPPLEPKARSIQAKPTSQVKLGLILALLYAAALSVFNVSIGVILNPKTILGIWEWGGIISPSVGNSLLILFLRMVVVVGLMPLVALWLYPPMWEDLGQFWQGRDDRLKLQVIGSGAGLLLSQVLIYMAFGTGIPMAVVITLFFIFPIVTVLGAWVLFGARPSNLRWGIMAIVLCGAILSVPKISDVFSGDVGGNFVLGSMYAVASGITFAGYVLLTQICGKKLHPMPFSFANFLTVFILCLVGVLVAGITGWGSMEVLKEQSIPLLASGVWLGILTLVSYILNNFAIKYSDASLASIVGATGPVMTALFAWIIVNEVMQPLQIGGMVLVTIGVVGLSLERILLAKKTTRSH
ncbi:EamA family transporter [Oscillatoriales cyanobacterium LEGE 11467]|uniref:EamA family transporter n=1 Tax=Zarconia navalis LEGE 11467 TaxID=1828826 RepID=A0A928Z856_9CYAN|nr:EamA family transporter [Zarconia navalis]MBE9042112.1 EamA family transporter [Zarconia navalis LEGE 11467]